MGKKVVKVSRRGISRDRRRGGGRGGGSGGAAAAAGRRGGRSNSNSGMVASQSIEPQHHHLHHHHHHLHSHHQQQQQQQHPQNAAAAHTQQAAAAAEMYCSPLHSHYGAAGEYYHDSHYYVHGGPPDLCPAHVCTIQGDYGPVTVPMVSTNSSPPIAMPVQVPPGHVVQQIVDESGTLRHVILSPQHPPTSLLTLPSHNPQHYGGGPPTSTNQPQPFYQNMSAAAGFPPHQPPFHSNLQAPTGGGSNAGGGGHPGITSPSHLGHSPPPPAPPNPAYYKDERAQRQHSKLKRKLHEKQLKSTSDSLAPRKDLVNGLKRATATNNGTNNGGIKEKGMNSVGTSEDGEESSVPDEDDMFQIVTDILSSVQAPKVSELSSRSALLQWAPPTRLSASESASNDSHDPPVDISESDLRYEVLLCDKISKEMKYKSIYSGTSLSCRIQDLKPGQDYSVCLQVHFDELQGSATDPVKFSTPPCQPDAPQSPKLISRTKNTLQLRWNAATDNGSSIVHYVLEYDEGKGGDFKEVCKIRSKQHTLQKLQPATGYRFRLAAVNAQGQSAWSPIVTYHTFDNPPAQPHPPTLLEATVHSLRLRWQMRRADDEFTLQMNDPRTQYGALTVYAGPEVEYVCNNLQHSSDYSFRLRAHNESGVSPWSEEVHFSTLPDRPARPSKPVVKGRIHAHSFKLKWEPPNETGGAPITRYILELNSGSGYQMVYAGTETEAVCDRLTPGTTYQLRVSCISAGGNSNPSDPCTVTTDAISPGQCAPPQLCGKPKATCITIRWQEPDYNGGAPVLEYEVEMEGPTTTGPIKSIIHKSKETECTALNILPGCEYVFAVRAVNRIGPGAWSPPLRVTSGAAPPNVPHLSLTCKSPFHVYTEWQEPPSNGAPVSEYRLEMHTCEIGDFTAIYQGNATSFDVKNLSPFTMYYFRLQAANSAGWSGYSSVETIITPAAPPAVVTSLRHESTPTSIRLYWSPPADNGAPITNYNIEIGDKTISTESNATEYLLTDLQPETQYKIKIQAVNSVAPGQYSSTTRVWTLQLPPAAPRLECIGVGHNYLKLKWGEGKNVDYTQYCVEMEVSGRSHDQFQCVYKGTAHTCKVNKLHEMTAYRFRINATNDAGVGDFSEEYEFVTSVAPPSAIRTPKVVEMEQRSCVLEWAPAKNAFTDPIVYQVQLARLKEQNFKQVYKGSETKCTLDNLEPGVDYSARICPIRLLTISTEEESPATETTATTLTTVINELAGPFSPVLNFTTPTEMSANSTPTTATKLNVSTSSINTTNTSTTHKNHHHHHHNRNLYHSFRQYFKQNILREEKYQFIFYAVLIVVVGILLSCVLQYVLVGN